MRAIELRELFKLSKIATAKSIAKAKSVVSPYFGALSFAPVYA